MNKRPYLTALACGWLIASGPFISAAQTGKNKQTNAQKNDERRENEAVQKAQKDVNAAEKIVKEAEKSARQAVDQIKGAERDQAQAAGHLKQKRDDLEAKHAELVGLSEARRTLTAARSAYEKAGEPILKALAETPKFKAAVEAAKNADRRLATLRENPEGDAADRLRQLADLSKTKLVPTQLEREALDAESALQPQQSALKAAEAAVAKAHEALEKAVEKDPALKSAKDDFEKAKDHVAAAKRESAREAKQLADAKQKLAREQQDLQQKIAADRKDDNKGKNNKNKK